MDVVLANLIWILVGMVITRLLDKPFDRWQRRAYYWLRGAIARFRSGDKVPVLVSGFRMGKWQADWIVIEGSTSDPCVPKNVICHWDPTPLTLPPDRQEKKEQIEESQTKLEITKKRREYHNGPTAALAGIGRMQYGDMEEPVLYLRLRPSDYYTLMATAQSLDDLLVGEDGKANTVRDKYLRNQHFDRPIPEFASAFPINLTVITNDGYILMSKRATEGIGGYADHIYPALNECVNPISDRSASGDLSLVATAQRAASHELNIEITEGELLFFTVGVDTRWYYYGLTGTIRSKTFSRDDIRARRSLGSKERWESTDLYFLPHDLKSIGEFMSETSKTDKWGPVGIVCLVQTLVLEFGHSRTENMLRKYTPFKV